MANDEDILTELERTSKEYDRDYEIDRILSSFPLDAYAVLDLQPGVPESDIVKTYRTKSLLIHPDKTKNPQAPAAFDRLKKAQTVLLDEKARTRLDEAIADARMLVLRAKGWTIDHPDLQSAAFKKEWRKKTVEVLIDNEERRQRQIKAQFREEGRAQRKEEEERQERKRKWEEEREWEETRDGRVDSWRRFQGKNGAAGAAAKEKEKGKKSANGAPNGLKAEAKKDGGPPTVKKAKKIKIQTLG